MRRTIRKNPITGQAPGVPMLDKALAVLDNLRLYPQGRILSDIARELTFPKNTVYRILNTLLAHEYITRDMDSMRYQLSRKLATFSYGSALDRTLIEASLDIMRKLRDKVGETTVISILNRGEGIVLEQIQGLHPFRFVCDPGTRQLIYSSAPTKCILAYLPEHELDEALKGVRFKRMTPATITSSRSFMQELAEVRRTGYGIDHAEALEGVHCVAAPVFNHQGYPVAAITITGPSDRMPSSSFPRLGALVKSYANMISKQLGYGLNDSNKADRRN